MSLEPSPQVFDGVEVRRVGRQQRHLDPALGAVEVLAHGAASVSLPVDVRHVTLATGQLFGAVGALGLSILASSIFWWCIAGIALTGVLNLGVSFFLAFRVAVRSRGMRLADRSRIHRAIRARLWHRPASFVLPPQRGA